MKKSLIITLALIMVLSLAGCGKTDSADKKSEGVMTYAEYVAAAMDSEVVVETYVQAKQSWWDNKATVYTQDKDGAYFLYNMACSEEDYAKLTPGTKIKVTGYKSEWSGEVEIVDATFEIEDGNFVAAAMDATSLLGTDDLIKHQNEFVTFKGLTVEPADESGAAFLYNWDGSGSQGDDLYFNVSLNGQIYSFTVESYLCDSSTEVYKAVEGLQVGDTIDAEGFLSYQERFVWFIFYHLFSPIINKFIFQEVFLVPENARRENTTGERDSKSAKGTKEASGGQPYLLGRKRFNQILPVLRG